MTFSCPPKRFLSDFKLSHGKTFAAALHLIGDPLPPADTVDPLGWARG